MFEESNFYLSISEYLNSKFYFNLSLLVENYYFNNNLDQAIKTLENFNKKDEVYDWYKTKKKTGIISKELGQQQAYDFINSKYLNFISGLIFFNSKKT